MPSTTKGSAGSGKTAKSTAKKQVVKSEVDAKPKKVSKKVEEPKAASSGPARSRSQKVTKTIITSEDRHRMIAEAAYYLAEKRGFQGGCPEGDWHLAAQEIDKTIMGG